MVALEIRPHGGPKKSSWALYAADKRDCRISFRDLEFHLGTRSIAFNQGSDIDE